MPVELQAPTPINEMESIYATALQTVDAINALLVQGNLSENDKDVIRNNIVYLETVIANPIMVNKDLTPINDAIAAGKGSPV